MGGLMSRNKGKRGEREVIKLMEPVLRGVYEDAGLLDELPKLQRNTLQSDGGGFDIVGLEWLALEVKYQEQFNLSGWWKQCAAQCGRGQEPVLIYRKNNVKWRVRMFGLLPAGNKRIRTICDITGDAWLVWLRERVIAELETRGLRR